MHLITSTVNIANKVIILFQWKNEIFLRSQVQDYALKYTLNARNISFTRLYFSDYLRILYFSDSLVFYSNYNLL